MAHVSQNMKKKLAPSIKSVLKKYNMKGSISVNNHSTLCVNLREGAIDFGSDRENFQVNPYWISHHHDGVAQEFLNELLAAMRGPDFYDHSDSMTDYFNVSHYTDINVGRFSKPYICNSSR